MGKSFVSYIDGRTMSAVQYALRIAWMWPVCVCGCINLIVKNLFGKSKIVPLTYEAVVNEVFNFELVGNLKIQFREFLVLCKFVLPHIKIKLNFSI